MRVHDFYTFMPPFDMHVRLQVVDWCKQEGIRLVVIGPEAPLVAGLADDLEKAGVLAFGPSQAAAQLEGSKAFMKVCFFLHMHVTSCTDGGL